MSIEPHRITVGGVQIDVVRKPIKNLHLGVYPPNGRVRVAAPKRMTDEAIRLAVVGKLGWIKRHQAKFAAQPRQSRREMVTGESHYFLGTRYRLRVVKHDGPPKVTVHGHTVIELRVRPMLTADQRERVLLNWYREQMKSLLSPLIATWEEAMRVKASDFGIKKMKTKWGSCNIRAKRIWLNLELAKRPADCLEYIVVHELAHLLERHHNDRFRALMDRFLPRWRIIREELKAVPLGHDEWGGDVDPE